MYQRLSNYDFLMRFFSDIKFRTYARWVEAALTFSEIKWEEPGSQNLELVFRESSTFICAASRKQFRVIFSECKHQHRKSASEFLNQSSSFLQLQPAACFTNRRFTPTFENL